MSKASRKAFLEQLKSGNIKTNNIRVLACVRKLSPITIYELYRILNMDIRTLSARLSELNDVGLIRINGQKKIIVAGKPTLFSKYEFVKTESNRKKVANERRKQKALNWWSKFDEHKNNLPFKIKVEKVQKL